MPPFTYLLKSKLSNCIFYSLVTVLYCFSNPIFSQDTPPFSNWINFNGNDGVIAIPTNNNVTYSDTDQITVEAWVKVNNGPTTSSSNPQLEADFILSRQDDWQIYVEYSSGQLYFSGRIRQHWVGSWPKVTSSAITEGTWYHVAMTASSASSSGQLKLYINGALVDTENYSVPSSSQGLTNTNHEIAIGAFDDTASRNFNGEVSDFRLWNDVRTQSEISSNLNQALSTDSSLLLYHKINEGSGTTINDSSGNSIDGTLSGTYQWMPFFQTSLTASH